MIQLLLVIMLCCFSLPTKTQEIHEKEKKPVCTTITDLVECPGYFVQQTLCGASVGLEAIDDIADHERALDLEVILLKNNAIKRLPTSISLFSKLQDIDISYNQLTELPDSICFLTQLKRINIEHNKIAVLPKEMSSLTELVFLLASHNQLLALPSLAGCTQLQYIELSHNKLTTLYDEQGNYLLPSSAHHVTSDGNALSDDTPRGEK